MYSKILMFYTYCIFDVILQFDSFAAPGVLKNDVNDAAKIDNTLDDAIKTLFAIEIQIYIFAIYTWIYAGKPGITYRYFNGKR